MWMAGNRTMFCAFGGSRSCLNPFNKEDSDEQEWEIDSLDDEIIEEYNQEEVTNYFDNEEL